MKWQPKVRTKLHWRNRLCHHGKMKELEVVNLECETSLGDQTSSGGERVAFGGEKGERKKRGGQKWDGTELKKKRREDEGDSGYSGFLRGAGGLSTIRNNPPGSSAPQCRRKELEGRDHQPGFAFLQYIALSSV